MNISENDGTYTAHHVTGPSHNMLRLKIGRGAPQEFVVTVLPPIGNTVIGAAKRCKRLLLRSKQALKMQIPP